MRRREFIALLGTAAVAWPLVARAQQSSQMRRIGVLIASPENDAESKRALRALLQGLQELGWKPGTNLQIDIRMATAYLSASRLPRRNWLQRRVYHHWQCFSFSRLDFQESAFSLGWS